MLSEIELYIPARSNFLHWQATWIYARKQDQSIYNSKQDQYIVPTKMDRHITENDQHVNSK